MHKKIFWTLILATAVLAIAMQIVAGQGRPAPDLIARRHAIENELQSIAIVERKLMIPMRDGKRMAVS